MYYFSWTLVIGFIIFLGAKYQVHLEEEANKTFEIIPVLIYTTLYPIFIGLFLRLPLLILEIRKNKGWTFDWIKVVAIGVPALYITTLPVTYYSFSANWLFAKEIIFLGNSAMIPAAGIVFGYVLLDSLKK